jgi:hypothetical protein
MPHWRGLACGLAAVLLLAPAAHAQIFLADYQGMDYVWPGSEFQINSWYESVSLVTSWNDGLLLGLDDGVNEYTLVMYGLRVTNVVDVPGFRSITCSGGTIDLLEDSIAGGTAATFDPNPPNGTVPGNFLDGTLLLRGSFLSFDILVFTASGLGSIEATLNWTGGTQYTNLPEELRGGWVLEGTNSNVTLPDGYMWQVDGELYIVPPTRTENSSWGNLKSLYR